MGQESGERRSDRTRGAILAAARVEFGNRGYEGTTIRAIAASVDVDPALVMHYFGSKEGLYIAALDVGIELPDLSTTPREQFGEQIVRYFLRKWDDQKHQETYIFLFRAALDNEIAAERMRTTFRTQMTPHTAGLLGTVEQADRRAAGVMTQLLGLAACRYLVRIPPLTDHTFDELVAQFAPAIQHHLTGPLG